MAIPQTFIDDLLNRVDIVALIDSHIPLTKTGKNYIALCPFHTEKTKSFNVIPHKQFFYCFGCGASGNAIGFLMDYQKLNFIETVETLAKQVGLSVPRHAQSSGKPSHIEESYRILEQTNRYYQQQLRQHKEAKTAVAYLQQRGVSGEIAAHFQIGFAPPGWDNIVQHFDTNQQHTLIDTGILVKKDTGGCYDRYRNRIIFPIHDHRGRVIGFGGRALNNTDTPKYLNSPETSVFHKGHELYGLHQALQSAKKLQHIVVVEGYLDVIALVQHHIDYAVASLGTAITKEQLQLLRRYSQHITFCFDGDQAGQKAAWRALENALPLLQGGMQYRFMFLPEQEDPDSFIRKHGQQRFEEQLNHAVDLSDFLFATLQGQTDINNMVGKSKLLKLISPLLQKLPEGSFRHLMLERLAKLIHVDIHHVQQLLQQNDKALTPADRKTTRLKPPSTMRLLIALLLQNPTLASHIPDTLELEQISTPGSDTLLKLIQLLRQNPSLHTGQLIEHWRGEKLFDFINQLASWQHNVPKQGMSNEFDDALQRVVQQSLQNQINELLQKSATQQLNQDEHAKLQQLIQSVKKKLQLNKAEHL